MNKEKEALVIGNGSSLRNFNFKEIDREKYDIIGTGFAFRYWDTIDFYPDIYVNVDHVVLTKNIDEIKEYILKKKSRAYILSIKIKEVWEDIIDDGSIIFIEELQQYRGSVLSYMVNWCSGSIACFVGIDGYRKISIIGVDCDYIEFIKESEKQKDGSLKIIKTPEINPNYFFDDYHRKGDYYNVPRGQEVHMKSWEELSYIYDFMNKMNPHISREIKNYNDKTSISEYITTEDLNSFIN